MNAILPEIRAKLSASVDEHTEKTYQRFFKEEIKAYGVKTSEVRKIANQSWKKVKPLLKEEIFELCEGLLASDYSEEAYIVGYWLPKILNAFVESDIHIFARWIDSYINNWAKCDSLCTNTVGGLITRFPHLVDELKEWARSENRWVKRAAAVSLVHPARKGKFLDDIFEIAQILLRDEDDMVQKGYGWMLKEASRLHQADVFNFVTEHKKYMPRTALRYAIELMPQELRQEAMKKDWKPA